MKKRLIGIINVVIMIAVLVFILLYTDSEKRSEYDRQVRNLEEDIVSMNTIVGNYLKNEQHICDIWANYIEKQDYTIEEAQNYISDSIILSNTQAHLIYADTLRGLSTEVSPVDGTHNVSYTEYNLFDSSDWISESDGEVNVSRAFTNPINGKQSIAFCNKVRLKQASDIYKDAILLRIVLVSDLSVKMNFSYEDNLVISLALIDNNGSYIVKDGVFKNTNFFEFYNSYNSADNADLGNLKTAVFSDEPSVFKMKNQRQEECHIAHVTLKEVDDWALLGYTLSSDLQTSTNNYLLTIVVGFTLLALFVIDLIYMKSVNNIFKVITKNAEEANRAKTNFLSTMSHDIRTPMNAIIGLTTITEKKVNDPEVVLSNLKKISLASNNLLTLINDVLDISKIESGKLSLNPRLFSIVDTAENLISISHQLIVEKNINFDFRVSNIEHEYLYADQLRIEQIFINLLSNAIKYTPNDKSVMVDLIEETSEKAGHTRLVYVVSDTGIGMSDDFMEIMYEAFSRQVDSRINSIQGTGLGLAITKQMVDLMGGAITCESQQGKGTKFTVSLDLEIGSKDVEIKKLDNIDVLIVDDDEILLETAKDTLLSLGTNVETACCGKDAISILKERRKANDLFDVAIIDWKMKDLDGIATAKIIREEIDKNLPILLISAYDRAEIEEDAKKVGADGFIGKPLFRSTLYYRISEVLNIKRTDSNETEEYSHLAGMHILIAEDNDINYEIISQMLEMIGVTTERAENGKICLEKLNNAEENAYSLIFMDIQMPEMNGLDATVAIRKSEIKWISSIPIIAMTADAFSENIAECFEVGMNGHIAKPVDMKLVIKEINKIKEGI